MSASSASFDFSDIRPYTDDELSNEFKALVNDTEFLQAVKRFRYRWLPEWAFPVFRPLLRMAILRRGRHIKRILDFQLIVDQALKNALTNTTSELCVSYKQPLDNQRNYLFICNHRDITMDPAICNTSLYEAGFQPFRIAIGDNLLSKPFVSRMMRLNKSFIVKRALGSPREKLNELKKLSAYIRQSIVSDKENIWIAQREGRAKDGKDQTDPTLIKMLMLSKQKTQSFTEGANELCIVPTSISYEWDPCDQAKAKELSQREQEGDYQKDEHEDVYSIAEGIQGWKGRVHLVFGEPINTQIDDADQLAALIDHQIIQNYHLHPSNLAAYSLLEPEAAKTDALVKNCSEEERQQAGQELQKRCTGLDKQAADWLIRAYAQPVYSKKALLKD